MLKTIIGKLFSIFVYLIFCFFLKGWNSWNHFACNINEKLIQQSIATSFDIPEVKLNQGDITLKTPIISPLNCTKHRIIPVSLFGTELTIAFIDPPYKHVIDALKLESKKSIIPVVISLSNYRTLSKTTKVTAEESKPVTGKYNIEQYDLRVIDKEQFLQAQSLGNIPSYDILVDEILIRALKKEASDIHFEPSESELQVRIDKDGRKRRLISFPREYGDNFANVLKIRANLNALEKRKPQEGGYSVSIGNETVDVRVSTLPTIFGERIAVRLFVKHLKVRSINDLGFSEKDLKKFLLLLFFSF